MRKNVDLKEGEVACPLCEGTGRTPEIQYLISPLFGEESCPKCKGCGKLDWIEMVVGKNEKTPSQAIFDVLEFYKIKYPIKRDMKLKD